MIVHLPTATPRDPQRPTVRLVPLGRFPGLAWPGQQVELQYPGVVSTIPGFIHAVHYRDEIVYVEPDFQAIHGERQTNPDQP